MSVPNTSFGKTVFYSVERAYRQLRLNAVYLFEIRLQRSIVKRKLKWINPEQGYQANNNNNNRVPIV